MGWSMAKADERHMATPNPSSERRQIPNLSDDVEFAEANELLTRFNTKFTWLNDRLALLDIETYFATTPRGGEADTERDALLRARMAALRAGTATATDRSSTAAEQDQAKAPEIAAGIAVLAGKDVATSVPAEQLAKLRQDRETIRSAIFVQHAVVDDIRNRKSYDLAVWLKETNDRLIVEHYRCAQSVVRSTAAIEDLHQEIMRAGFGLPRSDLLPAPLLGGARALGKETDWGSQISMLRRRLEARGVI
jgi:hypothetical protein